MGRPLYFTPVVSIFFLLFFLANSQRSEIGCLPYFYTWCYIGADVECMSEMCCTQLAKNTGRKNYASAHHCTTLLGYIFVPQTAQNGSGVWGTPATPTSLSAGQPNFARCLAISWAGTLYRYIFWGLLSRSNFARCKIHCVHILGSPILAALLHGTQPLGISQTLWRSAEGATYIRQGGHHVGHRAHSSYYCL